MINFWNKLDRALQIIYANFLMIQKDGRESAAWIHPVLRDERTSLHVILEYSGDLGAIEALGFETSQDKGDGNANGFINLNQLETIADSPGVVELRYGTEPKYELDDSVIEILARKDVSGSKPFVWEVERSTGTFSGNMGENVIVGIIDSGIDFKHKVFFKNDIPETRILRIWDHGLVKTGTEKSPDVNLLDGNKTYGVEYTDEMINKVIQKKPGAPKIRHKDCASHGTHVAAIAAGDGRQASFLTTQAFDFVGVAPKASIIMVKLLTLPINPPEANHEQRFKDAVSYILKFAKAQDPPLPVVINCSFGTILGPHDGLEKDIQFLKTFFENATGACCVFSAGNAGNKRHHAVITIPAGGLIEVPFDLTDKRTVKTEKDTCSEVNNTQPLSIEIWYKDISPNTIKLSLKVPGGTFITGPDLNQAPVTGTFDGKKTFSITHTKVESEPRPGTATKVTRNVVAVVVTHEGENHKTGTYTLKIEGPATTILHAWADINRGHFFGVTSPLTVANAGNIAVTDENTIADTRTLPYVLTVTAYDHGTGKISDRSSRGPVVDFSGLGPIATKPDIAAPGEEITSAWSSSGEEWPPEIIKLLLGKFYATFGGTSMAAPHITGVVALMLAKNKSLTRAEIFSKLSGRTATPATDFGKGKVDVKKSVDAV